MFIEKGGIPKTAVPHYMTLGKCDYIKEREIEKDDVGQIFVNCWSEPDVWKMFDLVNYDILTED